MDILTLITDQGNTLQTGLLPYLKEKKFSSSVPFSKMTVAYVKLTLKNRQHSSHLYSVVAKNKKI